jgi:uncharacterized protein (DUF39 family)
MFKKSIEEINARIRSGSVVVLTAEEIIEVVRKKGIKNAAREVDVVTTGTFSPMCSSGALLNIKQPKEKMKLGGGWAALNGVPAYAGPDCYPRKSREQRIGFDDMNEAILLNPRNCYQNYNVAVNLSDKPIYTYMGLLKPRLGNANYCSAGQLSPLLNDPYYRTIGVGTRVFLGGAQGYVAWNGTQHNPGVPRLDNGTPRKGAGTLTLIGDLKSMSPQWLRAVSFTGYGVSLSLAVGIPIPVIDEEMLKFVSVSDEELVAPIVDYSRYYPTGEGEAQLGEVTYAQLKSGSIEIQGRKVPTGCFSSYAKAREIAHHLKTMIQSGAFFLTQPVAPLPGTKEGLL